MESKQLLKTIRSLCEVEMARCEAVISASKGRRKLHEPMVDIHRGSMMMLQKVLALLDNVPSAWYSKSDLLQWYVNARSEGWDCEAYQPEGDHWKHAILTKNGYVAEIDIPGGTLIVYRPDRTQVDQPTPYRKNDYRANPRRRR